MKRIEISDEMVQGATSLERKDGVLFAWRLPCDRLGLFLSPGEGLVLSGGFNVGVRLRVRTDSPTVVLAIDPVGRPHADLQPHRFDLLDEPGEIVASVSPGKDEAAVRFDGLPAGPKLLEIWLPMRVHVGLRGLEVEDDCTCEPAEDRRPRWVFYGSSITFCARAHSPARTWPAVAARTLGVHHTNLGYGGQCHLDGMVARMIRDLPADGFVLKLGINVQGAGSLSPRTFPAAAIDLVQTIREKHPTTPITIVSPIACPPREQEANQVGYSLEGMRADLRDVVERLKAAGDANVRYWDGLEMFSVEDTTRYAPDLLHPDGDGMLIMGERAAKVLRAGA